MFNGVIWPDFTKLPTPEEPALQFVPFEIGDVVRLPGAPGERQIEVLSAYHTVPAVGFAVQMPSSGSANPAAPPSYWVYSGDTGPNPALWERLRQLSVEHLVIETAFGDDEGPLATRTRHLSPSSLGQELKHLPGRVKVHITHIKPGEETAVMREVNALNCAHDLQSLHAGQCFELGPQRAPASLAA
jgi:ribonuclease BN (tRNA processing enzyme)